MLTLDPTRLRNIEVPLGTSWLLADCMEARGKQDLWMAQKPEVLAVLREQAIVHSVESSNRIEGVTIQADRLRPVVLGKARPRDRSEEELAGYRKALDWIFSCKHPIAITPEVIRRLHSFAQGGFSGDAGKWKRRNNEIVEILPNGERKVRFVPTPANEVPKTVQALCGNCHDTLDDKRIPSLLAIATFIFDFLCIHPFRDGNGRVSRLLTTLLMESNGFRVARFASLERLIEESREEYYDALYVCSQGWHEGRNEIIPWWNHFLSVVRRAYKELQRQVESVEPRPAKNELVRQAILEREGQFTLSDLAACLPAVSPQLIKKVLAELKQTGDARLTGRGRGARWEVPSRKRRRQ